MKKPRISSIAAIGRNRELGKNGALIWRIPEDLKRLKALTMGHPIILGRKTYESIGHPLPGRTNIVISRDPAYKAPGCIVASSIEDALAKAREIDQEEIFVLGGAQIYTEALPYTDHLYLTRIDADDPNADTFFPAYDEFTEVIKKKKGEAGEDLPPYEWVALERPI